MTTYLLILSAFFCVNFYIHKTRRAVLMATMVDAIVLAVCAGLIELGSRIMESHP
jgi:hypothetical protein